MGINATLGSLNLSCTDEFGCVWTTNILDGWGGPGSSIKITNAPYSPGGSAGKAFPLVRHLAGAGIVSAPSSAALSAAIDRLIVACSLDDTLLTVKEDNGTRWCMVRRTDEVLAPLLTPTSAKWSIQVAAVDPRKQGGVLTGTTGLPYVAGGLVFPFSFPISFASSIVSGIVSLFNPGNATGPVTCRIDGPGAGPIISHRGSGLIQVVSLTELTLADGEWLDIDMEGQEILGNGQASRANWITSRDWSGFEQGANTWSLTAASYSTMQLTVFATPTDQ